MNEEFKLDLSEFVEGQARLRRRGGIVFHADRKKRLDEAIKVSMDDLLKAQGDISFVKGVKESSHTLAVFLLGTDLSLRGYTIEQVEVWLAHVVSVNAECECNIEGDWDSGNVLVYCRAYEDKSFQRLWWCAYFGITEEELQEREREAARKAAAEKARQEEARRQAEYEQLLQLAEKFNVDPKYLP